MESFIGVAHDGLVLRQQLERAREAALPRSSYHTGQGDLPRLEAAGKEDGASKHAALDRLAHGRRASDANEHP